MKIKKGQDLVEAAVIYKDMWSNEEGISEVRWTTKEEFAQDFNGIAEVVLVIKALIEDAEINGTRGTLAVQYNFKNNRKPKLSATRVYFDVEKALKQIYLAGYKSLAALGRASGLVNRIDLNNFAARFNAEVGTFRADKWDKLIDLIPALDKAIIDVKFGNK